LEAFYPFLSIYFLQLVPVLAGSTTLNIYLPNETLLLIKNYSKMGWITNRQLAKWKGDKLIQQAKGLINENFFLSGNWVKILQTIKIMRCFHGTLRTFKQNGTLTYSKAVIVSNKF